MIDENETDEGPKLEFEENDLTELGETPLTDETITQEMINEMKMLGLPKPEKISWYRWQRIQNVRAEHRHMIHMAAAGISQAQIAREMGYSECQVSKVFAAPEIKEAIKREIENIYGQDYKKALRDRSAKALKLVDDIMESHEAKISEKADMAKWVLEHSVGKAMQHVDVKKSTLTEVIVQIEQLNKLRDVNPKTELLSNSNDPFDTIIEQVIPQGMVVGKRTGGDTSEEGKE